LGEFIVWIYNQGYEITLGEVWRPPEQARANAEAKIGISNSLHIKRLAVDINLFKNSALTWNIEDYRPLGAKWKSMGQDHRWGGDFKKRDSVHFSIEHEGVK
jgi:hypothetical protein